MRQATPEQEAGARGPPGRARGVGRTLGAPGGRRDATGEGWPHRQAAPEREAGAPGAEKVGGSVSGRAARLYRQSAAASTGRRQALGGGTRNTAPEIGRASCRERV